MHEATEYHIWEHELIQMGTNPYELAKWLREQARYLEIYADEVEEMETRQTVTKALNAFWNRTEN